MAISRPRTERQSASLSSVVAQLAFRIAVMRAGQIVESRPAERILREPAAPYTRELLAALPEIPPPAKL